MKTVLTEFQHRIPDAYQIKKYISENDPDEKMLDEWLFETIYKGVDWMRLEKQQHEQTAIHITNVLMDALDNPKGGKFSGEDEFNKYWDDKFTTNKETLK